THAREAQIALIALHVDVPHLRMHAPAQCLPVDCDACADTGADRDIGDAAAALARAQLGLRECSRIHIGVELDPAIGYRLQGADQIRVGPAGLRRREHPAPTLRATVELDR